MPSWTPEQHELWKLKSRATGRKGTGPKPEQPVRHEPLEKGKAEKENPKRSLVRIVSFRRKLCDFDNITGGAKFHCDALRYAGVISDDDPLSIQLVVEQVKVKDKSDERTEITVVHGWEEDARCCACNLKDYLLRAGVGWAEPMG